MIRPGDDSVIYLYRHTVDMHKSINGLVAIVEGKMEMDPFSSALFVFCNANRNLVKLVDWEGNGVYPVDEAYRQGAVPMAVEPATGLY